MSKPLNFAVIMPTYNRQEGWFDTVAQTIEAVNAQTYPHWRLFLIGDDYSPRWQFKKLAKLCKPENKCVALNLWEAGERVKYADNSSALWCAGGVKATRIGINRAVVFGHSWLAFCDHDDLWAKDHLQTLADLYEAEPEAVFLANNARHFNGAILPGRSQIGTYKPEPCNVIKSAVAYNYNAIPLMFRDVYAETGAPAMADADLWERIRAYMTANNLKGSCSNKVTVNHYREGSNDNGTRLIEGWTI